MWVNFTHSCIANALLRLILPSFVMRCVANAKLYGTNLHYFTFSTRLRARGPPPVVMQNRQQLGSFGVQQPRNCRRALGSRSLKATGLRYFLTGVFKNIMSLCACFLSADISLGTDLRPLERMSERRYLTGRFDCHHWHPHLSYFLLQLSTLKLSRNLIFWRADIRLETQIAR